MAYAAFPLAVYILDVAYFNKSKMGFSINEQTKDVAENRLSILIETMKILHEQYDGVDAVVKNIRHIVDYVCSQMITFSSKFGYKEKHLSGDSHVALLVSLATDWSLSSGPSADGDDFASHLGALLHLPQNVYLPMSPVDIERIEEDTPDAHQEVPDMTPVDQTALDRLLIGTPPSSADDINRGDPNLMFGSESSPNFFMPSNDGETWGGGGDLDGYFSNSMGGCEGMTLDDLMMLAKQ